MEILFIVETAATGRQPREFILEHLLTGMGSRWSHVENQRIELKIRQVSEGRATTGQEKLRVIERAPNHRGGWHLSADHASFELLPGNSGESCLEIPLARGS